jgi:hypothetical protein
MHESHGMQKGKLSLDRKRQEFIRPGQQACGVRAGQPMRDPTPPERKTQRMSVPEAARFGKHEIAT